jgi:hypothetical protein
MRNYHFDIDGDGYFVQAESEYDAAGQALAAYMLTHDELPNHVYAYDLSEAA